MVTFVKSNLVISGCLYFGKVSMMAITATVYFNDALGYLCRDSL